MGMRVRVIEPAYVHLNEFAGFAGVEAVRPDARFKMAQAGSIGANLSGVLEAHDC